MRDVEFALAEPFAVLGHPCRVSRLETETRADRHDGRQHQKPFFIPLVARLFISKQAGVSLPSISASLCRIALSKASQVARMSSGMMAV